MLYSSFSTVCAQNPSTWFSSCFQKIPKQKKFHYFFISYSIGLNQIKVSLHPSAVARLSREWAPKPTSDIFMCCHEETELSHTDTDPSRRELMARAMIKPIINSATLPAPNNKKKKKSFQCSLYQNEMKYFCEIFSS